MEHLARARASVTTERLVDRVVAVHEHFGLDDRHDAGLLAQRGVAGERVRVHVDAVVGRATAALDAVSIEYVARHLANLAPRSRYSARRSRSPSRPSVTVSPSETGERLGAGVDLDAGDDALLLEQLDERRAVGRLLADRLVEQDHAADVVGRALGAEQHLAVVAPVVLGGLHRDRVEALLDGAAALVGGEDALARRDQRPGDLVELCETSHVVAPSWSPLTSATPTRLFPLAIPTRRLFPLAYSHSMVPGGLLVMS